MAKQNAAAQANTTRESSPSPNSRKLPLPDRGALDMPVPERIDPTIPYGVYTGMADAYGLLIGLDAMQTAQVQTRGDVDLDDAAAMTSHYLFAGISDPEWRAGFAMVLSEYLAAVAGGCAVEPRFAVSDPQRWKLLLRECDQTAGGEA